MGGSLIDAGNLDDDAAPPSTIGHLRGKVVAPEGTIPISGALVYLTSSTPGAIPDGVFCDRCVQLGHSTPYTFTHADGTFDLPAYAEGSQKIVVQKGQFRRVRDVSVVAGDTDVPLPITTLPGKMDVAHGDTIPKMALVTGAWDHIEMSLGKLGLGAGSYDKVENVFPPNFSDPMLPSNFLKTPATIGKYQIVFKPCSGSSGTTCDDFTSGDAAIQKTLQDWVAAGGKLYVTDYSYDYVRQPWPEYIDWQGQTSQIGSACLTGSYTVAASVPDQGLAEWLAVQGIGSFDVKENWTRISALHAVATTDLDGNPTTVTPKVWVTGGSSPATVSFERSCGRVLFSTYHTEESYNGSSPLGAQELALLYVLLEVGVCITPPTVH